MLIFTLKLNCVSCEVICHLDVVSKLIMEYKLGLFIYIFYYNFSIFYIKCCKLFAYANPQDSFVIIISQQVMPGVAWHAIDWFGWTQEKYRWTAMVSCICQTYMLISQLICAVFYYIAKWWTNTYKMAESILYHVHHTHFSTRWGFAISYLGTS